MLRKTRRGKLLVSWQASGEAASTGGQRRPPPASAVPQTGLVAEPPVGMCRKIYSLAFPQKPANAQPIIDKPKIWTAVQGTTAVAGRPDLTSNADARCTSRR